MPDDRIAGLCIQHQWLTVTARLADDVPVIQVECHEAFFLGGPFRNPFHRPIPKLLWVRAKTMRVLDVEERPRISVNIIQCDPDSEEIVGRPRCEMRCISMDRLLGAIFEGK